MSTVPVSSASSGSGWWLWHNHRIYTTPWTPPSPSSPPSSPLLRCYTWMAVCPRTRRIAAVGTSNETIPWHAIDREHVVDGAHHTSSSPPVILPGLIDSHIHVYMLGKAKFNIDLSHSRSIDELQSRVRDYIAAHPAPTASSTATSTSTLPWYVGSHWEQDLLGRFPTAADLDAVESRHPVFLWRACFHVAVVNSAALRLCNITRDTPDPVGGSIERDAHGEPTGLLCETAATLVQSRITVPPSRHKQYLLAGLRECMQMGLTCVQTNDEGCWKWYKELVDEHQLKIRVMLTILCDEIGGDAQPFAGETYGPLLSCHRVKLFADGALGAQTAALSQPYVQHRCASASCSDAQVRENRGILIHSEESMLASVKRAHEAGFRHEIHVIGDRAAQLALTALRAAGVPPTARPLLTHCQVLSASLIEEMRERGAIANIQPQFAVTDSRWVDERLPPALREYAYVWKTIMQRGVVAAGGSDAPIEIPSPLLGMHAAICRPRRQYARDLWRNPDVQRAINDESSSQDSDDAVAARRHALLGGEPWCASECLSFAEALHLYTAAGAYAGGVESSLGQLEPSFHADFVVLSHDPTVDPALTLLVAHPLQLWVDGQRVDLPLEHEHDQHDQHDQHKQHKQLA